MRACIALVFVASLTLAGCGHGGGGTTSTASSTGASQTGTGAPSGVTPNAAQWQVALAAVAGPQAPPALDQSGLAAWDALIAQSWPGFQLEVDPLLQTALQSEIAKVQGGDIYLENLRNIVIDTAAPPGLDAIPTAGAPALRITVPRTPGTWALSFTVDVVAGISTQVLGISISPSIKLTVTATITDIQVTEGCTIDASNPARPVVSSVSPPAATLQLSLTSSDPLLQVILAPLTQILNPIVSVAIAGAAQLAQQEVSSLVAQVPAAPGGPVGPPCAPVAGAGPLDALADSISDEIQLVHLPWGTEMPAIFSQPGYGNGTVTSFYDFGDSCSWTGSYMAAEAMRVEATGDPRALAGLTRALAGTTACVDVASTPADDGLYSRCAIPMSDPLVSMITGDSAFYLGSVNGVPTGSTGDTSRDVYIGVTYGAINAWLRVPSLQATAGPLVTRGLDYMLRHDWDVYFPGNPQKLTIASPVAQAPGACWMMITSGATIDPARYASLRAAESALTTVAWLEQWSSSREIHESYYKFQLGHDQLLVGALCETDPGRYRDYLRAIAILRDVLDGHQNAHFDATYGAIVPSQAPVMGARVQSELQHWALRDRRGFTTQNSQDPSIAKVTYSSPLLTSGSTVIAADVLPIEKRPCMDYIWIGDPFGLDGSVAPDRQYPGIDMLLPYWVARSYGEIP